jgi:hypothetical protein
MHAGAVMMNTPTTFQTAFTSIVMHLNSRQQNPPKLVILLHHVPSKEPHWYPQCYGLYCHDVDAALPHLSQIPYRNWHLGRSYEAEPMADPKLQEMYQFVIFSGVVWSVVLLFLATLLPCFERFVGRRIGCGTAGKIQVFMVIVTIVVVFVFCIYISQKLDILVWWSAGRVTPAGMPMRCMGVEARH